MSSACSWEILSRRGLGANGGSPAFRRTALTRASISASTFARSASGAVAAAK